MEIGKQPTEQLLDFCFKTLNKALFEMSQNKAESDRKVLANILMNDLNEKFFRLTAADVTQAFHKGVREGEQLAINPRTWFNWLNKQKMKTNKLRIEKSQEGERLQIETKAQNIDKQKIRKEFLTICLIIPYEEHCKGEEFTIQGINQAFQWLELNNFIVLTQKDKERMLEEVEKEIIGRKKFVHNKRKMFHPKIMCREKALRMHFGKWKKAKKNLRKEIYKILDNGQEDKRVTKAECS